MATTLTLIPQDDEGEKILDEFEVRTGLEPEDTGDEDERIYPLEGEDHRIEIVETLDDIDTEWTQHVSLGSPA
ncbi:MAG: hypothetical protein JWR30_368 [Conexibacter sp.]|jgi:hypothetical protein|nr:hypothetical protein [Conexibacter sp.]MCZ4495376.1 hypothetical protein [Conexibacter sp.]MDX6716193.1 hypothetical protein [Baekduia sp.]MDX6732291.1 hypothetical protein [Baekduia sp.]